MPDQKAVLARYLQTGREVLLAKLDGVSEYDARRPMVATGTNLLGVVKHVASVEAGYLGDCFGRPFEQTFPWFADDAEWNADMWATADETRESIVDLYHRVWRHSDATIEALDLEAIGEVPWWAQGRRVVTLQQILVHMIAETHRHAGHMDIVREMIDGEVGWKPGADVMPDVDADWWVAYRDRLEQVARDVGGAESTRQ
jgi:uncharacterized damage-inducible protein DinB